MIARIWTGAVRTEDGDAYAAYIGETGLAGYRATPGNRGAWLLRRDVGDRTEFVAFTLWDSLDAIKAFAGADPTRAVIEPEARALLSTFDTEAKHYELAHDARV